MQYSLVERQSFAMRLVALWIMLVAIDVLILRGAGTGVVHGAFSVLHDPGTTLTALVLVSAVIYILCLVVPVDLLRRFWQHWRSACIVFGGLIVALGIWWNTQASIYAFCATTPYPEDWNSLTARARLSDLQSNYWAAFNANSSEDMMAAKQDFLVALANARSGDCISMNDFLRLASLRAKWSLILTTVPILLLLGAFGLLTVHMLLQVRIDRRISAGLALAAAIVSVYPLLTYYSDWYLSLGETVVERPIATIAGVLFGSSALFLLSAPIIQPSLWQRLAQSLAAVGLLGNLFCVVWPQAFVHIASHFAIMSLAVVLFAEILLAVWVGISVKLFADSLGN